MGKLIIGLIVGLVIGAGGALVFGGGAMMGVGVGTGLSAGICSTIGAAQEAGLITPEQADEIVAAAGEQLSGMSAEDRATPLVGTAAACDDVMQQLREAAG